MSATVHDAVRLQVASHQVEFLCRFNRTLLEWNSPSAVLESSKLARRICQQVADAMATEELRAAALQVLQAALKTAEFELALQTQPDGPKPESDGARAALEAMTGEAGALALLRIRDANDDNSELQQACAQEAVRLSTAAQQTLDRMHEIVHCDPAFRDAVEQSVQSTILATDALIRPAKG